MKLRSKVLLILLATFLPLLLFFYFSIRHIVLRDHADIERQLMEQNVRRVISTLQDDASTLSNINKDWAFWDNTYDFMETRAQEYLENNLMDETFTGLQINWMAFVHPSGEIVYSKIYDLQNKAEIESKDEMNATLQALHLLMISLPPDQVEGFAGLLPSPKGPLLASALPILNSLNKGPSRGFLVLGRFFDEPQVERLVRMTDLDLKFLPMEEVARDSNLREMEALLNHMEQARVKQSPPVRIPAADSHTLHGVALIRDIFQAPLFLLEITTGREIYQKGLAAMKYVLISLLGMGLIFSLVTLHLWQTHVLARLTVLTEGVRRIRAGGAFVPPSGAIGHDEISTLNKEFSKMLVALEESSRQLKDSEQRYRSFVRNFQGIAFRCDLDFLPIFVHGAIESITGYQEEDLIRGKPAWQDLIEPEDRARLQADYNCLKTIPGCIRQLEYRIRRKDGTIRWVHEIVQTCGDFRPIAYLQGTLYDITDHKLAEIEVQRSRDELSRLSSHLQAVREEERTRIARQLHDDLGQLMMALNIHISSLNRKKENEAEWALLLKTIRELVDHITTTVQRISMELRPSVLESLGLVDALEWQVNEFRKLTGMECTLEISPKNMNVQQDLATTLFRITQESLTNVARHAAATRLEVEIRCQPDALHLAIRDNGRGIRREEMEDPSSFGLIQMRERVHALGGTITLKGEPGRGTHIQVHIPLPPPGPVREAS